MTEISLYRSIGEIDFCANGHCFAGRNGTDTVCAAVSVLACTLMERFENMRSRMSELHISYESGTVCVYAKAKDRKCAFHMDECIETLMCGFRMLASSFPQNVRVIEHKIDKGGV